jgi:mRNA interferase MazF
MVKEKGYVPDRGEIVWLDFHPQAGREQRGQRPALTVSFKEYNGKIGLGLFCPITSKITGYPFEVEVAEETIKGCILSDQVKSLDWTVRNIDYIEKLEEEKLNDVITNIGIMMTK